MLNKFSLLSTLFLIGCGTTLKSQNITEEERQYEVEKQLEIALIDQVELSNKLERIATHVFQASAPMCGEKVKKHIGITLWNNSSYKGKLRTPAKNAFNLTPTVTIAQVMPHSPAQKAGLKTGDTLLKVGKKTVIKGKKGLQQALTALNNALEKTPNGPVPITYKRGDITNTAAITPQDMCDYAIVYEDNDVINAYADGKRIILTRGIIEFTRTDAELALIIGHELAHNILQHIDKKVAQASAGTFGGLLIDILIGNTGGHFADLGGKLAAQAYSPEYEAEADYMGLYAAARAGYTIKKAPYLWRRMGARNQKAIAVTTTHPATAERFIALEKTVKEVEEKQIKNLPLIPDTKK